MLAQIRLETSLHVRVPLHEPLVHLCKQIRLLLKLGRQLVHVRVLRLALQPDLRVRADHVLESAAVEAHEHKVLKLGVHRDRLVVLGRAAHIDAVLRLAVGDDACEQGTWI